MNLEYSRRTIYGRLDPVAVENRPAYSFRDVRDDFKSQYPELLTLIDCLQLLPGHRLRVTCTNDEAATILITNGLSLRGFPVTLSIAKFVRTVRRLPHQMDLIHVRQALSSYGEVESIIRELDEIFTGVIIVKMNINQSIPSRVTIKGQHTVIVYKGQIRTSFTCGSTAHENRSCPRRRPRLPATPNQTLTTSTSPTPPSDLNVSSHTVNPTTNEVPSTSNTLPIIADLSTKTTHLAPKDLTKPNF